MIKVSSRCLRSVLVVASTDVTRQQLCGVQLERDAEGITRAIATDGHRIAVVTYSETEGEVLSLPLPAESAFAPSWMIEAAKAAFPFNDTYWIGERRIEPVLNTEKKQTVEDLSVQAITFTGDVGTPPPWRRVIPDGCDAKAVLGPEFRKALKKLGSEVKGIIFDFAGNDVKLTSQWIAEDGTTGGQDLGVVGKIIGCEDFRRQRRVGLNPKYVCDVLRVLEKGDIEFEINGELNPCLFRQTDRLVVVMPMRV